MANSVITLDNVSFRYPDAGRDALSGVSLSIEAGSFIAVLERHSCADGGYRDRQGHGHAQRGKPS